MEKEWQVHLSHTKREDNQCADWLANSSLESEFEIQELTLPLIGLQMLLIHDVIGAPIPQICNG